MEVSGTYFPQGPQEREGGDPRGPKRSPRASKSPKSTTRGPQERSKSAQDGFKGALRASHDGVKSLFRTRILLKWEAKNLRKNKNLLKNVSGFMMVLDIDF